MKKTLVLDKVIRNSISIVNALLNSWNNTWVLNKVIEIILKIIENDKSVTEIRKNIVNKLKIKKENYEVQLVTMRRNMDSYKRIVKIIKWPMAKNTTVQKEWAYLLTKRGKLGLLPGTIKNSRRLLKFIRKVYDFSFEPSFEGKSLIRDFAIIETIEMLEKEIEEKEARCKRFIYKLNTPFSSTGETTSAFLGAVAQMSRQSNSRCFVQCSSESRADVERDESKTKKGPSNQNESILLFGLFNANMGNSNRAVPNKDPILPRNSIHFLT
ncbi:hypothetical protein [Coxiella endosymbiont of Ornithodoros maritimus]|uniref:hypothetical protein n=1 Tax=Coxiella endosymbiont of Ornithodoros maritimus TaxID=1656172 RepID=UPI00226414A9|nr:hypothetical protein [Coxiella endosymbiont of Ornithodoros maritimus]